MIDKGMENLSTEFNIKNRKGYYEASETLYKQTNICALVGSSNESDLIHTKLASTPLRLLIIDFWVKCMKRDAPGS